MRSIVVTDGGSNAIAWASFALALCAFAFSVYWSKRTEKRLSLDEYWFRQIVAPKCVTPIIEFHDYWLAELARIENDPFDLERSKEVIDALQRHKNKIENSVWVVRIFSPKFQKTCYEEFEVLEDSFAQQFGDVAFHGKDLSEACSSLRQSLGNIAVKLLARTADLHGSALKPQKEQGTSLWRRTAGTLGKLLTDLSKRV